MTRNRLEKIMTNDRGYDWDNRFGVGVWVVPEGKNLGQKLKNIYIFLISILFFSEPENLGQKVKNIFFFFKFQFYFFSELEKSVPEGMFL